jgi:1-phosphatidylinositol-4-phosphate 5-kinase
MSGKVRTFKGLESAGKSGSFFFTTADNRFFVKTLPEREFVIAIEILCTYLNYLNSKCDETGKSKTLISMYFFLIDIFRIYGLHQIRFHKRGKIKKINIIVIGSIFNSGLKPHRIYDLKGSWYKRVTK